MLEKPKHLAPEYGAQFKDRSIVEAYQHRPPYPAEVFDILAGLISTEPRRVLDVGCGTGYLARNFVEYFDSALLSEARRESGVGARKISKYVEQLDAVDFSQHMIETGKQLPNGDHPSLRWIYGAVEDVALDPPYGLVTAAASLHWMDWSIVLPRFKEVLVPGGYLAIVEHNTLPEPFYMVLGEIIPQYSTNKDFEPYDLIEELEKRGLFQKVGEKTTAPVPFVQSIDDYIESFHSRNGFSRDRMEPDQAAAFDQEARKILLKSHKDGIMSLQVVGTVIWGLPMG